MPGRPAGPRERSTAADGTAARVVIDVNRWLGARRRAYSRWRGIRMAEQARLALADDARHAHGLARVGEAHVPVALGPGAERLQDGRPAAGEGPPAGDAPPRLVAVAWAGLCVAVLAPLLVLVASNPQVRLLGILLFAGLGCGTGVMCWWDAGEGVAQWALAIVLSLAVYALAHTVMIWAHVWHPNAVLLLALPSGISCGLRLYRSRRAVAGEGPPEADVGDH